MLVSVGIFSGCSSDEEHSSTTDAGAGGQTGTGGHTGSGGGTSASGGGSSSGGGASEAGTCTVAVGTPCDDKEDCPNGQLCCGKYQQGYVEFGCYDSCLALAGDAGGGLGGFGGPLWFELCNPKDTCEDTTAQCLTSPYLPSPLTRCLPAQLMGMAMGGTPDATFSHDKNAINCGTSVCGADEECCVRQPLEPYCAPKGAACDCNGGAPKADGGKPEDASTDAAPEKTDAAADAAARDAATRD